VDPHILHDLCLLCFAQHLPHRSRKNKNAQGGGS
jgi:hypothetical protein